MNDFIDDMVGDGEIVITRFPPEPNGYLHLGHVKSIVKNFEMAKKFNGKCNLRFDDTNPTAEKLEYVEAIKKDLDWLDYTPDGVYYTSNYFNDLFRVAHDLVEKGLAYVCELTPEEIAINIGTTTKVGVNSPYRDRSIEDNIKLLCMMRDGEIEDGKMVLRAKIDMSHPNMHMRDPIIYRVKHETHHNTGDKWCIYPMYDFAHAISDYIEGISHSICTLEFEVHRPLYDWFKKNSHFHSDSDSHRVPRQIEFARLNLSHTIMSKRKLKELVDNNIVSGWDDPRMPTIAGMRNRGIPAEALIEFCKMIGVSKRESLIEMSMLDKCTRDVLNRTSNRRMVVFDPIKVTITNWEGDEEWLPAKVNPENENSGVRMVNFGKNLLIEREDFMEDAPKKFHRLSVGKEVRFKYGYYVTCHEVIKDEYNGRVTELLCTYDPETKGGWIEGRKVKGTIHWVNDDNYVPIKVKMYDRLFTSEVPTDDFLNEINPDSIKTRNAMMEAAGPHAMDTHLQFERNGYYVASDYGTWNRTLPMRDGYKLKK